MGKEQESEETLLIQAQHCPTTTTPLYFCMQLWIPKHCGDFCLLQIVLEIVNLVGYYTVDV